VYLPKGRLLHSEYPFKWYGLGQTSCVSEAAAAVGGDQDPRATMSAWQEAQLQALSAARNDEEITFVLMRAARDLGFDYWAYGIRAPVPLVRPRLYMVNNYPREWHNRYVRENYVTLDPTVAHARRSVMPLQWSEELFASCRSFWEEARAHGLCFGWAQACYNAKGVGGLLTLARSHDDLSRKELDENGARMSWLTYAAHEKLAPLALSKVAPEAVVSLSTREIDVLRWTAEGKTSADIALIVSISERTVNYHVNNALAKLDASNKTAATVKAAMLGLL
jgi:LuxR family quorum-sensing system transcriptional regulator SolR